MFPPSQATNSLNNSIAGPPQSPQRSPQSLQNTTWLPKSSRLPGPPAINHQGTVLAGARHRLPRAYKKRRFATYLSFLPPVLTSSLPYSPMAVRPSTAPARRSLSQDSVARQAATVEKAKSSSRRNNPQKKGSSHADVIDRLDFSGVGGPSTS